MHGSIYEPHLAILLERLSSRVPYDASAFRRLTWVFKAAWFLALMEVATAAACAHAVNDGASCFFRELGFGSAAASLPPSWLDFCGLPPLKLTLVSGVACKTLPKLLNTWSQWDLASNSAQISLEISVF